MNSNYSDMHETTVSSALDNRLSTLLAISDLLGSAPADELGVDTLPHVAGLMQRLADEAHDLADELWRRLRTAKGRLGVYPSLAGIAPWAGNEIADRVTGSAGDRGASIHANDDGEPSNAV